MQGRIIIAVLLALFCAGNDTAAQDYIYKYYTAADGLPTSEVIALAKDEKGFLWCGTSAGVSRFDGYTFTNFSFTADGSKIGYVNCIKITPQYMLLGTTSGLFCKQNNQFIKLSTETAAPQSVNDILITSDNTILIATAVGPAKLQQTQLDITGKNKITLSNYLLPQWGQVLPGAGKITMHIKEAPDGAIYIAGYSDLYRLYNQKLDLLHSIADSHDRILSVFPVSKTKVYYDGGASEINTIENGVHTNSYHEILYQPGLRDDLYGYWYVGTSGLYYFHPQTGTASRYINTMEEGIVWPSAMLEDAGFFWVASHDGLVKISPSLFTKYTIPEAGTVKDFYSFLETANGHFYLGSNRGRLYEKKEEGFLLTSPKPLVPTADIRGLYKDENNRLWAASGYQGLVLLQQNGQQLFTEKDGLHDNSLSAFLKTRSGNLYVIGDAGLTEIMTTDKGISFRPYRFLPRSSQYGKCFSGIEAPDGTIWICGDEGLFYLQNDALHPFLLNGRQTAVTYLIEDSSQNIWMATEGEGILKCRFNEKNQPVPVQRYNLADGLNSAYYLTLLADSKNNIWAGSSKGLTFIGQDKKNNGRILNFTEANGFIKAGYNYISLYQDKQQRIWAATIFGITSFNPEAVIQPAAAPAVFITNVTLLKTNSLLYATAFQENAAAANFKWDENALSFAFTALDFNNPDGTVYYYRLDGLDTLWMNSGKTRGASYENLRPGKYTFRVKAINSKGILSNNEALYSFIILPPFWQQAWFIITTAALAILLVYLFIKRREKNIKEKEAQKTEIQKLKADSYQHQLEIEQVVNYFATSINEQQTTDEMLWDVAKNCIARLGFEDCVIYLKDETRDVLIQKAAWGPKTTDENKIINPIEIPMGKGVVGTVAVTGKPEIIGNTLNDERYIMDDLFRFSEIAVPITDNGKTIGVIDSEHPEKHFYSNRHLQILTTIASLCVEKMDKIKAEQASRQKETEVLKLNKNLATSQLTALRAQMNPHFIFNALNSVQQYILQGNVDEANKYLSKFSRLQREILNNSDQQFIPLEKEKEMLELYLQLERLRFNDSFSYEIIFDENIEADEIMVPPMIIQPFVENAIWHGLMPKQGSKKVFIEFVQANDSLLYCTITDNGIGREAAAAIKQTGRVSKHKSKGLSLVYERLHILETQLNHPFGVSIQDLKNEDGTAAGTRISLTLFIGG